MKLIYPCLNLKFDMDIVFMINYFFSGRRYPYEMLLVINFVNLKIKPT
jgi:hypothetical protein